LELVSSFVSFHQKIRRLLQFWIFRAPSRPDNLGFVQFQKLRPYRPGRTRKKMKEKDNLTLIKKRIKREFETKQ
jgi:hypothetical protein